MKMIVLFLAVCLLATQGQGIENVESLGEVSCQPDTMTVVFKIDDLEGNKPMVGGEDCNAEIKDNNDTYTVVVPLDGCDTESRADDDNGVITFTNKIVLSGESSDSVITRMDNKVFPFGCIYDIRGKAVSRSFKVVKTNVTYYEKDYGNFTFQLDFFKSDKFEQAYGDSEYPINVQLSEKIFFQTTVKNPGKQMSLFVEECAATPSMDADHKTKYILIKDGCLKDSTLKEHASTHNKKSFSFKSFRFTKYQNLDAIYVHCKLRVCHEDSDDSVCKDGCKEDNNRRRRAVRDEGSSPNPISGGPLMIFGGAQGASAAPHSHFALIVGCAVGAIALIALVVVGAVIYLKRQS